MPMYCCAIGCQHSVGCLVVFSWYDIISHHLQKVNKSLGANFDTLFSIIFLFFDVPQYLKFDYIKDISRVVYLTTKTRAQQ